MDLTKYMIQEKATEGLRDTIKQVSVYHSNRKVFIDIKTRLNKMKAVDVIKLFIEAEKSNEKSRLCSLDSELAKIWLNNFKRKEYDRDFRLAYPGKVVSERINIDNIEIVYQSHEGKLIGLIAAYETPYFGKFVNFNEIVDIISHSSIKIS